MEAPYSLTRAELRELDRLAVLEFGLPSIVLMENAGRGAAQVLERRLAERGLARARVAIACGPGNNGGDGYVVARHLANAGHEVLLLASGAPAEPRGDAATMRAVVQRMRLELLEVAGDEALPDARSRLARADLLVDALLGTGFTGGRPRPGVARLIELLNAGRGADRPVAALDLPSGLDADTGAAAEPCVRADLTLTFAAPKLGFGVADAARFTGQVLVADIGAPRELFARVAAVRLGTRA